MFEEIEMFRLRNKRGVFLINITLYLPVLSLNIIFIYNLYLKEAIVCLSSFRTIPQSAFPKHIYLSDLPKCCSILIIYPLFTELLNLFGKCMFERIFRQSYFPKASSNRISRACKKTY